MTVKPVKGRAGRCRRRIEASRGKDGRPRRLHGRRARSTSRAPATGPGCSSTPAAFEARRTEQKAALRQRWTDEGLPGTVTFLHLSGEMEFMLDHEAIRWGRSLQAGRQGDAADRAAHPGGGQARPALARADAASPGGRRRRPGRADAWASGCCCGWMPPPPEVDTALLPPDLDRPRSREERIEWFLSSIYCTCQVKGDVCTGHFYTLASCNPNGCAVPNAMRKELAELIDKGLTDQADLRGAAQGTRPGPAAAAPAAVSLEAMAGGCPHQIRQYSEGLETGGT